MMISRHRRFLLGFSALPLWMITTLAGAETLPASVVACVAEADVAKRVACYDREVARITGRSPPAPSGPSASSAAAPKASAATAAAPSASAGAGSTPSPETTSPARSGTAPNDSAPANQAAGSTSAATEARHIQARVVSVENFADEIVVHLDNDQVWRQIQPASAEVSIRVGDTVKIDREVGTYWLSAPRSPGVSMKVARTK